MAPGGVPHVAQGVVGHIGAREAETEHEGDPAKYDQLSTHVAIRVQADHEAVAVDLARVVENARQGDVLVGDRTTPGVLD